MKKRICEIFAVAVIMFSLYHFAEEWKQTNVVMQEAEKIPDAEDAVVQPSAEVDEPDTEEMIESEETPDFTKQNEEVFYEAAHEWGLDQSEAADYYERLCEDNVFGDGIRRLSYLKICDLDGNGQKDMVVMVQGEVFEYGEGFIYFYMNEDEAYCFEDEEYPFFSSWINIVSGDFDCDGNIEIAFESPGTGCGGSGDWYNKILKYKNHGMEKMEFPNEFGGNGIQGIEVDISQEVPGHTYIAYCPYLDETIVFESNHESRDYGIGGGESRGYYNIYAVEYEGRDALVATEYLFAGGHSDCVGYAKFLIVWEKDGSGRVEKWWIESADEENDPLFDGFAEMDYCLFTETNLDYGVTLDYYRYGIYGDFVRTMQVFQIKGTTESGRIVFSNGDVTYRMTYPDGSLEKLGEFMCGTTFSPDGKYLAYCTGNRILADLCQLWSDEMYADKLEKWEQMCMASKG